MNTISQLLKKNPGLTLQVAGVGSDKVAAMIVTPNEERPDTGRVIAHFAAQDIQAALNGLSTLVIL